MDPPLFPLQLSYTLPVCPLEGLTLLKTSNSVYLDLTETLHTTGPILIRLTVVEVTLASCYQLYYVGRTYLFGTAELFSHFMPTRSDMLLHILTDTQRKTDMDRFPCRTTEQHERWSSHNATQLKDLSGSVDAIYFLSLLLPPLKATPSTKKARSYMNTETQQIKVSNQQIQVVLKTHNVTVKSLACIAALILVDVLSVFCAQLVCILCNMLKRRIYYLHYSMY